jgi:hypothetical protein
MREWIARNSGKALDADRAAAGSAHVKNHRSIHRAPGKNGDRNFAPEKMIRQALTVNHKDGSGVAELRLAWDPFVP